MTADMTIGLAQAGRLDGDALIRVLDRVDGLAELVVHPGLGTDRIARDYAWGYHWDVETASLCSGAVRDAIADQGIDLISIPTW